MADRPDDSRLLAYGGALLLLCGLALGEIYALFISHAANSVIQQAWQAAIGAAAAHDEKLVETSFAAIADLAVERGRYMNAHSHIGAIGLLAMALAALLPLFQQHAITPTALPTRALAIALLSGGGLQAAATVATYYEPGFQYLEDAGSALIVVALAGFAVLALRGRMPEHAQSQIADLLISSTSARVFTRLGLLLIFGGLCAGLLRAWHLGAGEETEVYAALDRGISALERADLSLASTSMATFKQLQSRNALLAAAHSHAVEFGMLAVLLACLQPRVRMNEIWRRRWSLVYALGAIALPVCVYLAPTYGMRAAFLADASGGAVMAALIAMTVGLSRR
jgi:hypothetical protein